MKYRLTFRMCVATSVLLIIAGLPVSINRTSSMPDQEPWPAFWTTHSATAMTGHGAPVTTDALIIADRKNVPASLLTPAHVLALRSLLANAAGVGSHQPGMVRVLLLGTRTTPNAKAAVRVITQQHPTRLYLLGMTHLQRLTIVIRTFDRRMAIYINKQPGSVHNVAALLTTIRAAKRFIPVAQRRAGGLTLANAAQVDASTPLSVPDMATPSSYYLNTRLIPPVKDQGNTESCVGWATSYYYKTYQEAKEHGWSVRDPRNRFSPWFIWNQLTPGANQGTQIYDAMQRMVWYGDVAGPDYPYEYRWDVQPTEATLTLGNRFRASDFGYLFYHNPSTDQAPYSTDIGRLKRWLAGNHDGFVIAVPIYASFYPGNYSGGLYYPWSTEVSTQPLGYHALFVYGYNDNVGNTGYGAFAVMNSWGTRWGYSGAGWLSYEFVQQYAKEGWAMYDAVGA